MPASHLRAKERFAARPKGGSRHYVVLEAESPDQTEAVKILSPANSFLLFDSSVLHMNDPSREARPTVAWPTVMLPEQPGLRKRMR